MQVAKLFASLGFKVDDTGFKEFETKITQARKATRAFSVSLKTIRTRLNDAGSALDSVNKKLDGTKVKQANQRIASSANRLANAVERSAKGLDSVMTNGKQLYTVIGLINQALGKGVSGWKHYNKELDEAKRSLAAITAGVKAIPNSKTVRVSQTTSRGVGTNGAIGGGGNAAAAAGGGIMAIAGRGIKDFFRAITPATAVAGGLVTAGFATKEVIQQGREMNKMKVIMKSATESQDHLTASLAYVRKEANRLGQDVYEMGMGFAKMQQAAKDKINWNTRKTMFTGLAELSTTYGLSQDDQKGIWRALTQMFTKGKIEAEEEGQMAERGLPAKEMVKLATKRTFEKQGKEFSDEIYEKLRKKGALKMTDIADEFGKIASEIANHQGALDDALKTSLVAQMRLKNSFREMATNIMDSGLDKFLYGLFTGVKWVMEVLGGMAITVMNAVKALGMFIKAIYEWIQANTGWAITLTGAAILVKALTLAMFGAGAAATTMAARYAAAMLLMRRAARRFIPIALIMGIMYAAEAVYKHFNGEENFATLISEMFVFMYSAVSYYTKRMKLAWYELVNFFTLEDGWLSKFFDENISMNKLSEIAKLVNSGKKIQVESSGIITSSVGRGILRPDIMFPKISPTTTVYVNGQLFPSTSHTTLGGESTVGRR